jgi:hypothetical protein
VSLHIDSPKERQFAILATHFSGYADLSAGTTAKQTAEYGFPSGDARKRYQTLLQGEFHDNFVRTDDFQSAVLWSPCGKSVPFFMVLNAEVGGDSTEFAFLAADQITGLLGYRFQLSWRDCNP